MSAPQDSFQRLFADVKEDPNVVGLILQGSRGKGFENEFSDYDALLIVADDASDEYKKRYDVPISGLDLPVCSLSEFRAPTWWGSLGEPEDRYDYAHCNILVDRTGEVRKIVEQRGQIPREQQYDFVYRSLDGYVNAVFRSVKAWRNNNPEGAHFEAASSIPYFLDALFGVHGRPRPYYGYIRKEFEKYPIEMPWEPDDIVHTLLQILQTADLKVQQKLLKESEAFFREKGYEKMWDAWEGKDKWAMALQI
ncbi:nucleotidyltransferase domain-containing protein [Candidatus Kaiserbacteria bacterium]|nr:nucleotidyltransferase domain-containing protein [Candidatus Kaiserbacteria bacterium]